MRIGILALQGAFIEHEKILEKLGGNLLKYVKKRILKVKWME